MFQQVEGGLIGITPDGIVGWASDRDRPGSHVRILVLAGGVAVAGAIADRYDLQAVRTMAGPGIPGFAVRLDAMPDWTPPFELTLRTAGGVRLGMPMLIRSTDEFLPAMPRPAKYEGFVDLLGDGRLFGWAWNAALDQDPVALIVLDGQDRIGRAVADRPRDDLKAANKRGGLCGFEWELPTTLLDGRPHSLRVMTEDGRFQLENCPISFGPTNLHKLYREIAELRTTVNALVAKLQSGVAPPGLDRSNGRWGDR